MHRPFGVLNEIPQSSSPSISSIPSNNNFIGTVPRVAPTVQFGYTGFKYSQMAASA